MKTAVALLSICASLCASQVYAKDIFNDQKPFVDYLLSKNGAVGVLKSSFGSIDTSLDCFNAGMLTFKVYLTGKLSEENAQAYGVMTFLSASAVDHFKTDMMIDEQTFAALSEASTARVNDDQVGTTIIQQCQQILMVSAQKLVALP